MDGARNARPTNDAGQVAQLAPTCCEIYAVSPSRYATSPRYIKLYPSTRARRRLHAPDRPPPSARPPWPARPALSKRDRVTRGDSPSVRSRQPHHPSTSPTSLCTEGHLVNIHRVALARERSGPHPILRPGTDGSLHRESRLVKPGTHFSQLNVTRRVEAPVGPRTDIQQQIPATGGAPSSCHAAALITPRSLRAPPVCPSAWRALVWNICTRAPPSITRTRRSGQRSHAPKCGKMEHICRIGTIVL